MPWHQYIQCGHPWCLFFRRKKNLRTEKTSKSARTENTLKVERAFEGIQFVDVDFFANKRKDTRRKKLRKAVFDNLLSEIDQIEVVNIGEITSTIGDVLTIMKANEGRAPEIGRAYSVLQSEFRRMKLLQENLNLLIGI